MSEEYITLIIKAVTLLLCSVITYVVVPYVKAGRLSKRVRTFVRAADKLARSGTIAKEEKLSYVIGLLRSCGVEITAEVEAVIEAEVTELDLAIGDVLEAATEDEE